MNFIGICSVSGKSRDYGRHWRKIRAAIYWKDEMLKRTNRTNISTAKIAALNEITIFGLDEDIKLQDIFKRMKRSKISLIKRLTVKN